MLSICIPTYEIDVTALIKELHVQLKRSQVAFEILVLDDSSNAAIEVESIPELKLHRNEENIGRHASRNLLASMASFQNLLFLDADVLPYSENFISDYLRHCDENYDFVFGGIDYQKEKPQKNQVLRWKYGLKREAKNVNTRNREHYQNLISMGFMVKRNVFLDIKIDQKYSGYGQDILFSYLINKNNYHIRHIENPVIHYGLETNDVFLEKVAKGLQSTYLFEKENLIPIDFRPVQRASLKLEKTKTLNLFLYLMEVFKKPVRNNLLSSDPSMRLLDLFKLYFYSSLKR